VGNGFVGNGFAGNGLAANNAAAAAAANAGIGSRVSFGPNATAQLNSGIPGGSGLQTRASIQTGSRQRAAAVTDGSGRTAGNGVQSFARSTQNTTLSPNSSSRPLPGGGNVGVFTGVQGGQLNQSGARGASVGTQATRSGSANVNGFGAAGTGVQSGTSATLRSNANFGPNARFELNSGQVGGNGIAVGEPVPGPTGRGTGGIPPVRSGLNTAQSPVFQRLHRAMTTSGLRGAQIISVDGNSVRVQYLLNGQPRTINLPASQVFLQDDSGFNTLSAAGVNTAGPGDSVLIIDQAQPRQSVAGSRQESRSTTRTAPRRTAPTRSR